MPRRATHCDLFVILARRAPLGVVFRRGPRTWTAVSKPPYWTAVALWPNGGTTYHGGGLFAADDEVQINSVDNRRASSRHEVVTSARCYRNR